MSIRQFVIIPAHNEAATIAEVVSGCRGHAEVIVVDDGSSDSTEDLARATGADVVRNDPGRGYDGALQRGFERADELDAHSVVTLDADGQHDPGLLPLFLEPLGNGQADLVIGVRDSLARVSEWLFSLWGRARFGLRDPLCGMKGYRMELFREHGCFDSSRSIGTELALWALRHKRPHLVVEVPTRPRLGQSRFGGALKANGRILRALLRALWADAVPPRHKPT